MAKADDAELLEIDGRMVRISSPMKPYFARDVQLTKLDIVRYFLAVAPGALRGILDRPVVLKRFVNGSEAEPFYHKRAPSDLPEWMRTVTLSFPSGVQLRRSLLIVPLVSRGSSTWVAWSCTRTRSALEILIIRMS